MLGMDEADVVSRRAPAHSAHRELETLRRQPIDSFFKIVDPQADVIEGWQVRARAAAGIQGLQQVEVDGEGPDADRRQLAVHVLGLVTEFASAGQAEEVHPEAMQPPAVERPYRYLLHAQHPKWPDSRPPGIGWRQSSRALPPPSSTGPGWPLLDLEAALDRGLVAARLAHDDLELELVGEAGEVFGKLELGHLRWQLHAEPRAFPLDDELVSDDLDLARSADLGMRPRDRVPADDHGLADRGQGNDVAVLRRRDAGNRDVLGRSGEDVPQQVGALELLAVDRDAADLPRSSRKPPEKGAGGELVEGRLGALEEQLGQAVVAHRPVRRDSELLPAARALELELFPRVAVDQGVEPQVAVRIVELEEDIGLPEGRRRPARCPGAEPKPRQRHCCQGQAVFLSRHLDLSSSLDPRVRLAVRGGPR